MKKITRTFWGAYLQTVQHLNIPYVMHEHSTLNEKFNVQSGIAPAPTVIPTLKYFCLGNGGHFGELTGGGDLVLDSYTQLATNPSLFKFLPFVLREVDNDLTPKLREKYAMRREETINGLRYVAYYLKRIDTSSLAAELTLTTTKDGVVTSTPFQAKAADLSPKPIKLPADQVTLAAQMVSVNALLDISLNSDEVEEIVNAANIIYGDKRMAMISEIGMVSGVDRVVQASSPSTGPFEYHEALAAQITAFMEYHAMLQSSSRGLELEVDVGATEPLFKMESVQ